MYHNFWTIGPIYLGMYSSTPELIDFISTLSKYFLYFSCTLLSWRINWGKRVHSMYYLYLCIRNVIPYLHSLHSLLGTAKWYQTCVISFWRNNVELNWNWFFCLQPRNSEHAETFIQESIIKFKEKTYFLENMTLNGQIFYYQLVFVVSNYFYNSAKTEGS